MDKDKKSASRYTQINVKPDDKDLAQFFAKSHKRPLWAIIHDALILYSKVYEKGRKEAPEDKFDPRGRRLGTKPRKPQEVKEAEEKARERQEEEKELGTPDPLDLMAEIRRSMGKAAK
jgi:hypothetical protein